MNSSPVISVVIPTRDREEMLSLCLRALAPGIQLPGSPPFEVIVTDDGERDGVRAMIGTRFPWVRWTQGPKRGAGENRNHGVSQAYGDWIAFTDDDCIPSPNWLFSFWGAAMEQHQVLEGCTMCPDLSTSPFEEAPVNMSGSRLWSCNLMIHRSIFDALGGYDSDFTHWNEDVDFRNRLTARGIPFQFVSDAVVHHPSRRVRWGANSARRWESRVLMWYKEGNRSPCWRWLISHQIKYRLGQIAHAGLQVDSLRAIPALAVEAFHVVRQVGSWERKYRKHAGLR